MTKNDMNETITLMQTKKIGKMPIVVLGGTFWQSMRDFIVNSMLAENTISPVDLEFFSQAQSPGEVVKLIRSEDKK